jgi:hypothetical protein
MRDIRDGAFDSSRLPRKRRGRVVRMRDINNRGNRRLPVLHGLRALSCFLMHAAIIGSRLRGLWARVLL